jgi:hypothetical protein
LALKRLSLTNPHQLSGQERADHDDRLMVMQAMANPKKTAAVYFAMSEASSVREGRPLSEEALTEAADLCRAFKQEPLTNEERQAIERFAQN